MENRTRQVAKSLWGLSDGNITNLRMQKLAYLCHVAHLHEFDSPLIAEGFEAWDYGPVCPELYHLMSSFGGRPVRNVFGKQPIAESDIGAKKIVDDIFESARPLRSGRLVALTHRAGGAWHKTYKPNVRGLSIPNELAKADFELMLTNED